MLTVPFIGRHCSTHSPQISYPQVDALQYPQQPIKTGKLQKMLDLYGEYSFEKALIHIIALQT